MMVRLIMFCIVFCVLQKQVYSQKGNCESYSEIEEVKKNCIEMQEDSLFKIFSLFEKSYKKLFSKLHDTAYLFIRPCYRHHGVVLVRKRKQCFFMSYEFRGKAKDRFEEFNSSVTLDVYTRSIKKIQQGKLLGDSMDLVFGPDCPVLYYIKQGKHGYAYWLKTSLIQEALKNNNELNDIIGLASKIVKRNK